MIDSRDLPLAGRLSVDDDGRRVQCHLCGRWYKKLGIHVSRGHDTTPDEYREEFGLDRHTSLASPELAARLAAINGPRLNRIRPPINLVTATPIYQQVPSRPPRRLELRLKLSAVQTAHLKEHPQAKKSKGEARPTTPELAQGPHRLAEKHRDPAWRRDWLLKVRPRSVLSDEQIMEARALVGQVSQAELAARWGVSVWTVGKAQRGQLKTLAELLIALDRDQPRS